MSDGAIQFMGGLMIGLLCGMSGAVISMGGNDEPETEPVEIEAPTTEMAHMIGVQCMTEGAVRARQTEGERWGRYTAADALKGCMGTCERLSPWGDDMKVEAKACALSAQQYYLGMTETEQ